MHIDLAEAGTFFVQKRLCFRRQRFIGPIGAREARVAADCRRFNAVEHGRQVRYLVVFTVAVPAPASAFDADGLAVFLDIVNQVDFWVLAKIDRNFRDESWQDVELAEVLGERDVLGRRPANAVEQQNSILQLDLPKLASGFRVNWTARVEVEDFSPQRCTQLVDAHNDFVIPPPLARSNQLAIKNYASMERTSAKNRRCTIA